MRVTNPALVLSMGLALLAAGCGGSEDDEREPEEAAMKPEETVFRDYVTAPGKVQDRTDAAMDEHRKALESQIEDSESPPAEPEPE